MNMNPVETSNTNAVFRLIAIQGPDRGKEIDLVKDRQYIMGRAEDCDIRVDMADKTVSRRHARIEATEKQIVIAAGEGAKAALQAHRYLRRL